MKKIITLFMIVLLLSACAKTQKAEEAPVEPEKTQVEETQAEETLYTYEGIEAWDEEMPGFGMSQRDAYATLGSAGLDMDAFIHSKLGEFVNTSLVTSNFGTIDSEELVKYWSDRGMIHEAHDVEDADHQWTSLIPVDVKEGQKLPLLFVWHGNNNPVVMAEGYGYGEVAAEKGWIVVYPWAANGDEYLTEFDRILAYAKEHYPVDESCIYSTGFSKGGRISAHLALERANVLAAVSANGTTAAASFYTADGNELPLDGPQQLTASDFEEAEGFVPVMFWGGEYDALGAMPYDADYKIDGINGWLTLQGNSNLQSLEHSKALLTGSEDETKQKIGLDFDKTEVIEADDTLYHVGSFLDADGNATVCVVECDGAMHWPTPYMSVYSMDFLSQFSK